MGKHVREVGESKHNIFALVSKANKYEIREVILVEGSKYRSVVVQKEHSNFQRTL